MIRWLAALGAVLVLASAVSVGGLRDGAAQGAQARVRVIHASPDAPNVDVYADDAKVLTDVPYKEVSDYLPVPSGPHNFKVYATGADPDADDPVIDADATLAAGKDYSVAAVGTLAEIAPAVFEDNNAAPAAGKAHVRVLHLSPDAPGVDIAVASGPVLFANATFPNDAGPSPVDAGTYDLEVRPAGTTTVALAVPDVAVSAGMIYTAIAVGLLEGTPELEAVLVADSPATGTAPTPGTTPAAPAPTQPAPAPTQAPGGAAAPAPSLPAAGTGDSEGSMSWWLIAAGAVALAALALAGAGLVVQRNR